MIAWYWLVRNNGPVDKKIVNIGNIKDQFHSERLSINCFINLLPFSAPMKSLLKPKGSVFGIILGYLHNGDNDFRVPIEYKYIYIHIYGYVSEWIHDFDAELHLSYTQQSISKNQHTI